MDKDMSGVPGEAGEGGAGLAQKKGVAKATPTISLGGWPRQPGAQDGYFLVTVMVTLPRLPAESRASPRIV